MFEGALIQLAQLFRDGWSWISDNRGFAMKYAILPAVAAFSMLAACAQQSPADANAAAMVDAAERQADGIESAADKEADALKNQADQLEAQASNAGGYTGERLKTRANALDREADIIEDQGEAKADAIEDAAKAEANRIKAR